jgi:hypothetical protein
MRFMGFMRFMRFMRFMGFIGFMRFMRVMGFMIGRNAGFDEEAGFRFKQTALLCGPF